jgi:hypothetical protein
MSRFTQIQNPITALIRKSWNGVVRRKFLFLLNFPNRRMHLRFQSKFDPHIWSFPVIFLFSKAYIVLHINEFYLISYIFSNVTVVSHSAKSDLITKPSSNPINDLKTLIPFYSIRVQTPPLSSPILSNLSFTSNIRSRNSPSSTEGRVCRQ